MLNRKLSLYKVMYTAKIQSKTTCCIVWWEKNLLMRTISSTQTCQSLSVDFSFLLFLVAHNFFSVFGFLVWLPQFILTSQVSPSWKRFHDGKVWNNRSFIKVFRNFISLDKICYYYLYKPNAMGFSS